MKRVIRAKTAVLKDKTISNCQIVVENGIITEVSEGFFEVPNHCELTDLGSLTLSPGLVDEHVHGGNGADVMDCTYESLNALSVFKLKEGVTSFCPTISTTSIEQTKNAVKAIADAMDKGVDGAKILGSFLEGPYITGRYCGTQNKKYIREIDINEIKNIIEASRNSVKIILIAPEKDNAHNAIRFLVENGIKAAIGHTDSLYYEALTAINLGANIGVHTFNSMRPLQHREPGTVGAILNSDDIYAEIICDGVHVNLPTVEILLRCKTTKKVILVTNCISTGGLPNGEYTYNGIKLTLRDGIAKDNTGTVFGSTLTLINAVKNVKLFIGLPLADSINMASLNPAEALGLARQIGSIEAGKQADLTAFDDNFNVAFTMVSGAIKYTI